MIPEYACYFLLIVLLLLPIELNILSLIAFIYWTLKDRKITVWAMIEIYFSATVFLATLWFMLHNHSFNIPFTM